MATTNKKRVYNEKTHEGAKAVPMSKVHTLERSVYSCLLWEDTFYEDGEAIGDRIYELSKLYPIDALRIAQEARHNHNLRHAPLLCVVGAMASTSKNVADVIQGICTRPDDLTEIFSIYRKYNSGAFAHSLKKGVGRAFNRFDEYQLAKYNRKKEFTLKDLLHICHPHPKDEAQSTLFNKLLNDSLDIPNTWETRLSSGEDKKEVFKDLIESKKLGALAFIRNLRKMEEVGISREYLKKHLVKVNTNKILPFQLVTAGFMVPWIEKEVEILLTKTKESNFLKGRTLLLSDVSYSMCDPLNSKTFSTRSNASGALAMIIKAVAENVDIYRFGSTCVEIPPREGFALAELLKYRQEGTYLGQALDQVKYGEGYDRLIVLTDEQSADRVCSPKAIYNYMINVAPFQNGVGYGKWTRVNGWSDSVIKFMKEMEG